MKVLAVVNPVAGAGRALRWFHRLRASVKACTAEVVLTDSVEHLRTLARQAVTAGYDTIVSCGGDGTLHHLLAVLAGTSVTVGIVPLGRGNDVAHSLGIPRDPRRAWERIFHGHQRSIDLARVGSHLYASVAGIGLDAEVARRVHKMASFWRGRAVYLAAILQTLITFRPRWVRLTLDGTVVEREVMLVAIANGTSYGGGITIAPHACMDDGRLDVCIVGKAAKPRVLGLLPSAYRGRHIVQPFVEYHQVRRVDLWAAEPLDIYGDGEYLQSVPATIEILPRALTVCAPAAQSSAEGAGG
jgi:diacylglycerol kinase (ATP)